MTSSNFATALKLSLVHEGGFVNNPADPGGATMKGVTQAVYDAYRRRKDLAPRSVRAITNAEVDTIYRDQYWRTIHADEMPAGVDYCMFDYSINSGPGRAVKDLQRALGVKVDGIVGMGTMTALQAADDARLINDVCDRRLRFLKSLRTWKTFGKGWARRVEGVRASALAMVTGEEPAPAAKPIAAPATAAQAAAKAPETAQAQLKTPEGVGLTCSAAAAGGEKVRQVAEGLHAHVGMDTVLGRLAFAVFTLLMLLGGGLVAYSYVGRIRERGGLGGFVGSVFRGGTA